MSTTSKQILVEKGRFLMLQGEPSDSFFILKKGRLEVLVNEETMKPTENDVAGSGRRISIMDQSNLPIGEVSAIEGGIRTASVRALEESELIQVAGGPAAVTAWLKTNLSAGLLIARTLSNRISHCHNRWHQARTLAARMRTYSDNFAVLYAVLIARMPESGSPEARLLKKGRDIIAALDQKDPPSLTNIERNVPPTDIPLPLHLPFPEMEEAYFLHTMLAQDESCLAWLMEPTRHHALQFLAGELARILPRISFDLRDEMQKAETSIMSIFGEEGVVRGYIRLHGLLDDERRGALKPHLLRLTEVSRDLRDQIVEMWGPSFRELATVEHELRELERLGHGGTPSTDVPIDAMALKPPASAPVTQADDSSALNLRACIESLSLSPPQKEDLQICMGIKESRPQHAVDAFWRLYPRLWFLMRERDIPELTAFLRYGIASPEPVHLPSVFTLQQNVMGPVMYGDQWLSRIYAGDSLPSRDELGQTMEEYLRGRRQVRYAPSEPDTMMEAVLFEVEQMFSRATRAFSGGRGELVTLKRTQEDIRQLGDKLLTPLKVAESVVQLVRLDFSAFLRDVRVVFEGRSEFLPKDILPFWIILPAGGERGISWQEFEGRSKDTPGRIVLPLLPEEDVYDLVLKSVARFRWNLGKIIAGADWMSPAEGGLTGNYFDYVNFYKKNPELSEDQKAKMAEQFSNAFQEGDKFAIEYLFWIKMESQGIQKLNKVARRIFAEFCPFPLEIRKKLFKLPAFEDILRKDSYKRLKRKLEIERRIVKLEKSGVAVGGAFDTALRLNQEIPE